MENNNNLFRLRTKRTRIRTAKKHLEKKVRALAKQSRMLWKMRQEIPLVPLEKPYQKGFVRFFVLREDIAKTKMADFFNEILQKINTYQYSDNRKFQKKKRKRGKKIYVPRAQNLHRIPDWQFPEYKKLKFSVKEQAFFVKTEVYDPHQKKFETYYEFRDPWRFVLRVKPYMITHYKPVDIELEREIAQVSSFLDRHKIQGILQKKVYCRRGAWKKYTQSQYISKFAYNSLTNNNLKRMKLSATEIAELFEEM